MTPAIPPFPVRRGFVRVGDRAVHYRIMGTGAPALFIHSSPTNGSYLLPDMAAQAHRYTCIAFDTPGFGLSDPLPLAEMRVADLAAAIVVAMDALGLPALPIFGTHSGAAIALELGYRFPEHTTGLVLDGVPIFTRVEVAPLRESYFTKLIADPLGGHFAAIWTRFRDQSIWFPWCARTPAAINEYDLAPPATTHRWTEMFYAAAAHYKPAYWAATAYCDGAIEAAAGLAVPAIFTASDTDMLFPHLERLPPLRPEQEIVRFGSDPARKRQLTGEGFARFGSPGAPPEIAFGIEEETAPARQFLMDRDRALLFRHAGRRAAPAMLLLHDLPGSARALEPEITAIAADRFVIAPDLPGSGDSDPLPETATLEDHAAAIERLVAALDLSCVTIRATGFATSLALVLARRLGARCAAVEIDGLFLPDADEGAALRDRYAPPIAIEADGSHWYRLWLMLRDMRIYWPWYDHRRLALRRVEQSFEAWDLHHQTVEVMKQHAGYARLLGSILRQDAAALLASTSIPITQIAPSSPLGQAHGPRLASLLA